jgi:heme/copper-type cytochrome/quinol oxidase subunit 3
VHRTGALYGQFNTLEQQKDTASLGMWIFLVTEVMFFGGIMLAYTINRHTYFHAFAMGSNTLSLGLGGFNTVVLLASSFTMAMAVWSSQTGKRKLIPMFLSLTILSPIASIIPANAKTWMPRSWTLSGKKLPRPWRRTRTSTPTLSFIIPPTSA